MQVPLRGRAQVELGLLDQDHEAADACVDERRDRADERQPAVLGSSRFAHDADRALRRRSVGASSDVGRRLAGKNSAGGAPSRFRLSVAGRPRVEEERPPPTVRLDVDARVPVRDVVAGRHRRRRLEQRPDRGEHGRLARRRLADEHAHRARLRARRRARRDSRGSRRGRGAPSRSATRGTCSSRRTGGSPAARRAGASGTGTTRARTASRRAPCSRAATRSSCSCGRTP